MRILIIANNCEWRSWDSKISELKEWFRPKVSLETTLVHTSFEDIPWTSYIGIDAAQKGEGFMGIDPAWYDNHITPMGIGYDAVLFVLPMSQWKEPNKARGWRTDYDQGPVQLHIGCDEKQRLVWPNFDRMDAFYQLARHELLHAMYMITGQGDMTHFWWDRGQLEYARDTLVFPQHYRLPGLVRAVAYLTSLLNRLLAQEVPPSPEPPQTPPQAPELPPEPSNREKLYRVAYDCLGLDMAPTENEFGCAEALYYVLKKAGVPELPNRAIVSTSVLDKWLKKHLVPVKLSEALPGDVIMSPTGWPGAKLKNGHTGILGKHSIMSNNSASYKWDYHWTLPEWRAYYENKGRIPTLFYRWN